MDHFEGLPIQQSLGIKISDKDDFATFEVGRNAILSRHLLVP